MDRSKNEYSRGHFYFNVKTIDQALMLPIAFKAEREFSLLKSEHCSHEHTSIQLIPPTQDPILTGICFNNDLSFYGFWLGVEAL